MTAYSEPFTEAELQQGVEFVAARDTMLGRVFARYGGPPFWRRPAGFATLMHIILEQKISLASARAVYDRLCALAAPLTAESYLSLSDAALLSTGMTRSKMRYGRHLATALRDGELDLAVVALQPDDEARAALQQIRGIGPWTASIYLIMVLGRPDVWPIGDRALAVAAGEVWGMPGAPDERTLTRYGEPLRPWRTAATMLFWHYYLSTRGNGGK